ncbi:hypothetical protein BGZ58_004520 [Dissophora ornata]|nr:hypothetical protein BGZ58_004520 [Dissophora ornata]
MPGVAPQGSARFMIRLSSTRSSGHPPTGKPTKASVNHRTHIRGDHLTRPDLRNVSQTSSKLPIYGKDRDSMSKDNNIAKGSFVTPMPRNFLTVSDSERIEGMDKMGVQELFTKRHGASRVSNEAFSIKAARMSFREPPPPDVPVFVQKAMMEYEHSMARYEQQLQEQKQQSSSTIISAEVPPPKLPLPLLQHQLRNVRHHPESVAAPHPPFRVTFVISKKQISKLATHRNLARKKLTAAVETVFREHARPGYEYMIFAKQTCMTTTQAKLVDLMKKDLAKPTLYGDRNAKQKGTAEFDKSFGCKIKSAGSMEAGLINGQETPLGENEIVKVRWKNNRPPLYRRWWRHALPNPLARIQQSDAFLDKFCKKDSNLKE